MVCKACSPDTVVTSSDDGRMAVQLQLRKPLDLEPLVKAAFTSDSKAVSVGGCVNARGKSMRRTWKVPIVSRTNSSNAIVTRTQVGRLLAVPVELRCIIDLEPMVKSSVFLHAIRSFVWSKLSPFREGMCRMSRNTFGLGAQIGKRGILNLLIPDLASSSLSFRLVEQLPHIP